jgi:tRNA (guanosine-2'-O-)-methyltransferase
LQRDSESTLTERQLNDGRVPWDHRRWSPEAVIATLEPLTAEARRARLRSVIERRLASVVVLMDAPHDPHNGGAVMRSCDAFGVQELHVVARSERFQAAGGVAKGTERWVDVIEHADPGSALAVLRGRGFELVATHPQGQLLPEQLADLPKAAILLGNEHDGISEQLARAASSSVRIPMRGFVESLNVSVAAAVLLAAATRDRPGDLGLPARQLLYARGLYRSVARAGQILAASASQGELDTR